MPDKKYSSDVYETGGKIREERKARKMSQHKLGEMMGISGNTISRYEIGDHEMSIDTFFRFADALDASLNDLAPQRFSTDKTIEGTDAKANELMTLFLHMNEADQDMLLGFAHRMAEG